MALSHMPYDPNIFYMYPRVFPCILWQWPEKPAGASNKNRTMGQYCMWRRIKCLFEEYTLFRQLIDPVAGQLKSITYLFIYLVDKCTLKLSVDCIRDYSLNSMIINQSFYCMNGWIASGSPGRAIFGYGKPPACRESMEPYPGRREKYV
jgi:hypothetical protein